MEIERKFLLLEGNWVFATFDINLLLKKIEGVPTILRRGPTMLNGWEFKEATYIEQGYLDCLYARRIAYEQCSVDILFPIKDARVRKQGQELTLTFKSDGGLKRNKVEIPIDAELFRELWEKTKGQRVIKTRYIYTDGTYDIKINVYEHDRLVVAEVEFTSENEAEAFPVFGKDVTCDSKYKNANLAR